MFVRAGGPAVFVFAAVMAAGSGCADPARVDMAVAAAQEARAEALAREAEIAGLRERQAALLQQMQMLTGVMSVSMSREPRRDDVLSGRLTEVGSRLERIESALARLKEPEEVAPEVDIAAPRRAAEERAEERAAAVRKVQSMIEAGEVKVTVYNGRAQLTLMRPLDEKNPYRPGDRPRSAQVDPAILKKERPKIVIPMPGPPPPPPAQRAPKVPEVTMDDPVRF